jgi:hypothetical protein
LLEDLHAVDGGGFDAAMPQDMTDQNRVIIEGLEKLIRNVQELVRRHPEKAGSLGELDIMATEVKTRCASFFPRLSRHVGVITAFVKSMEDFILRSSQG